MVEILTFRAFNGDLREAFNGFYLQYVGDDAEKHFFFQDNENGKKLLRIRNFFKVFGKFKLFQCNFLKKLFGQKIFMVENLLKR